MDASTYTNYVRARARAQNFRSQQDAVKSGAIPFMPASFGTYSDRSTVFSTDIYAASADVHKPLYERPGKPTNVIAVYANERITVTWTAPTYAGSAPIQYYSIRANNPAETTLTSESTSVVFDCLPSRVSYKFRVFAHNMFGESDPSNESNMVTIAFAPEAPYDFVVRPGNGRVFIDWLDAIDNSSQIMNYTVAVYPSPSNGNNSYPFPAYSNSATITGLTNGVQYRFRIYSTNALGNSVMSFERYATPTTVPEAPTNVVATPGNTQASVSFVWNGSSGGSQVRSFTVTAIPAGTSTPPRTAFIKFNENEPLPTTYTAVVYNLFNGLFDPVNYPNGYTFTVTATNDQGTSAPSLPSNAVICRNVPTAPRNVTVVGAQGSAIVSWNVPADNGGVDILRYTVRSVPGGLTATVTSGTTAVVSGLTNGAPYVFGVVATNAVGDSITTWSSTPVVPKTLPNAPRTVVATGINNGVYLSWMEPDSDGGSTITSYSIEYLKDGALTTATASGGARAITISGLVNGDDYTFTVRAINAVGTGPGQISNGAQPVASTVPNAPTILSSSAGDAQVTISWSAPADGGLPIQWYLVKNAATPNETVATATGTTATVTGLTNGVSYTFVVVAVNLNGESAPSTAVTESPVSSTPVLPVTPVLVHTIADDAGAYVYFTVSATTPAPTNYEYSIDGGAFTALATPSISSPVRVPLAVNDVSYSIRLRAANASGASSASNSLSITPVDASTAAQPYIMYDPSNPASYAGSGTTLSNVGSALVLNGTIQNPSGVTYNGSIKGGVLDFNGVNGSYIKFPSFDFGNKISVMAWIYPRYKNDINGLFTNAGPQVATNGFKFQWNFWVNSSRALSFQSGNGTAGSDEYSLINTIVYDTWQHVAYVFDKTARKIAFFLNGEPVAVGSDVTTVENIKTDGEFAIGGYSGGSYTMNAQLGSIKIYNDLLDAAKVRADYNATVARFA